MRGQPARWAIWLLEAALVVAIFWLGTEPAPVFAAFTKAWQLAFGAVGLHSLLERLQQTTSHQLTTRSLPAMLTYGAVYVGLCLVLLRLLLGSVRSWWQAVWLYAGVAGLCGLLLLAARLGGNVPALYRAGRQLIDFLVSPLPVVLLVVLLSPTVRKVLAKQ